MTYEELKKLLNKANNAYYKKDQPIMTDYEFDMKLKELEQMEMDQGFADEDSPTQKPGSDLSEEVLSNKHKRPMLSLENTYNRADLEKWYEDMQKALAKESVSVVIQPKFDGGSAAIRFKNGKVIKALTRGSGEIGEDITQNVSLLDWSRISPTFSGEVRGELIITKDGFLELNKDGKYQNARNLLSGSMKLLDKNEFLERAPYIKFYAYWLEDSENQTYMDDMLTIQNNGFENFNSLCILARSLNEIYKDIEMIRINKDNLSYDIDGAVMKINLKAKWDEIGSTAKFPRWAKAFKYEQESAEAVVKEITFEVGRTGKITPLCWFEPVFIDGSTIQKATLNNKDFYDKMDIAKNDIVRVQKAAAIIPQIISVKRTSERVKIPFPEVCPCCGSKLVKHNDEHADLYCDNKNCSARIVDIIVNYTHTLEIDGFAEIIVERLYNKGILTSIQDLYTLNSKKSNIKELDRLSENIANKLCQNIENSKNAEFWKLLAALGIPNVGAKTAKVLSRTYKKIDVLMNLSISELMETEDIAEITATGIYNWFHTPENIELIKFLKLHGQNMDDNAPESSKPRKLEGKSFCITGALSLPRSKYEELIESLGGKVVSSVGKSTNYLITNDENSGSSKNKKAKQLGIPVLNEKEFLEYCDALYLLKN